MVKLDLQADPREIITRMWPEHAKHLSPAGNTMGGGSIDPDEGVVCNCGQVLGFPTVQDEADYVAAEPDRPDTSGAQTGDPDDEPDWTPQQTEREHAPDPDGDLWGPDGVAIPAQPLTGDHLGEEATADEAGRNDLATDSMPTDPDGFPRDHIVAGQPDLAAPGDEAQAYPGPDAMSTGERTILRAEDSMQADYEQDIQGQPSQFANDTLSEARQRMMTDYGEPDGPPKGVMPWRDQGVVPAEDPIAARVVTIDPTMPYGPQDVEHQLLDISGRIERGVHFQRYWEERQFAAKATYVLKSARERLNAKGSAKDMRDAAVTVACAEEWQELELCEAMVRAVRETMHNLRSLQSGYQTVARSVNESTRNPAGSRGRP